MRARSPLPALSRYVLSRHVLSRHVLSRRAPRVAAGLAGPALLSLTLAATGGSLSTAPPRPVPSQVAAAAARPVADADTVLGARIAGRLADVTPAASAPTAPAEPVAKRAVPPRASRSGVRRRPAVVPWVRPAAGPITSRFGPRWGRMHQGLDIGAPTGTPVRAVGTGRITFAGRDGAYGNLILLRHSDGTVTAYAHLSRFRLRSGTVRPGTVIGYVGSTGRSTGPHLHFEVRTSRGAVNPLPWLRARGVRI